MAWRQVADFWVPGMPVGQPRPKGRNVFGGVQIYTPDDADEFKAAVAKAAHDAGIISTVKVKIPEIKKGASSARVLANQRIREISANDTANLLLRKPVTFTSDDAIRIDIEAFFPRPQRLCRKKDPLGLLPHTVKPDGDNVMKAAVDAAVGWELFKYVVVGAITDDARIASWHIDAWWLCKTAGVENVGCKICLSRWEQVEQICKDRLSLQERLSRRFGGKR